MNELSEISALVKEYISRNRLPCGALPVCAGEHHQALHPYRRHPDTGHSVPGGGAVVGAGECGCLRAGRMDAVGDSGGGERRTGLCAGGGCHLPQSAD